MVSSWVPTHSKSISSFMSLIMMNADTTPAPREVFMVALMFPYQTYLVLAMTVPTVLGAMVNSRVPSSVFIGVPSATQSYLVASPRYLVLSATLVRSLKVCFLLWQMGAATHDSS